MPFKKAIADTVLVKCGRHCCLCRRFRPTMLQVHHIEEESKGGSSTEDNAIALCITCHSDVHTKRPFAQRFSKSELLQHRDRVYRMVEDGQLGNDDTWSPLVIDQTKLSDSSTQFALSELAIHLLVCAAEKESQILYMVTMQGEEFSAGSFNETTGSDRRVAELRAALNELVSSRLITHQNLSHGTEVWQLNLQGYLVADSAAAVISNNNPVENKAAI